VTLTILKPEFGQPLAGFSKMAGSKLSRERQMKV